MKIILVGLSYRTTPVEIREKLHLSESGCMSVVRQLMSQDSNSPLTECVALSTCNRIEIYAVTANPAQGAKHIQEALAGICELPIETLLNYLYKMDDELAVEHLMRVASGLDSMILGESQILGQTQTAYAIARSSGSVASYLDKLFAQAIHTGKRARTETEIGRHTTSVSHAAAILVEHQIKTIPAPKMLVVGAGEMAQLAATAIHQRDIAGLHIINRTFQHAQQLARQLNATAHEWSRLWELLAETDVVITSTDAPHTVFYEIDIRNILQKRNHRPIIFIDIAVPRDIEGTVANLPGVSLFDIDDLQSVVDENLQHRKASIPAVEAIITEELAKFMKWRHAKELVPLITDLRRKVKAVADTEAESALLKLSHLSEQDQEIIFRMAHRIVNKVLHEPTIRLKENATTQQSEQYAQVIRELFALEESAP